MFLIWSISRPERGVDTQARYLVSLAICHIDCRHQIQRELSTLSCTVVFRNRRRIPYASILLRPLACCEFVCFLERGKISSNFLRVKTLRDRLWPDTFFGNVFGHFHTYQSSITAHCQFSGISIRFQVRRYLGICIYCVIDQKQSDSI